MAAGPTRTVQAKIGDVGEQRVRAELSAFAVCNEIRSDFGLDLLCHWSDEGTVGQPFFVQIKSLRRFERKSAVVQIKTSSISFWAASPVPVYLVICVLEPRPQFYWVDAVQEVIERHGPPEAIRSKTVSLKFSSDHFLDGSVFATLGPAVKDFASTMDRSISAMVSLRDGGRHKIPNEEIPLEFAELNSALNFYYAIPIATRALLIESFFLTWERIENRSAWGYPIHLLRLALLTAHQTSLKTGIKALLYMESAVIWWVEKDLRLVSDSMELEKRREALIASLREFHRTPYVRNPDFTPIVGGKLALIAAMIFREDEVVPVLARAQLEMSKVYEEERAILEKGGMYLFTAPDCVAALHKALTSLISFTNFGSVIPSMAADQFERSIISSGWPWEDKVHAVSYHHLYEDGPPRSFNDMTSEAQELLLAGLREHSDPRVRLDCLQVYGRDIQANARSITRFADSKMSSDITSVERERLSSVKRSITKFVKQALIARRTSAKAHR
jgi:hypothetical protein